MKKFLKILLYILAGIILLLAVTYLFFFFKWKKASSENMALLGPEAPVITFEGHTFRDLNKNGKLDIYEDSRQPVDSRVEDLFGRMNIEEKAGLLFFHMMVMDEDGSPSEIPTFSNPFSLVL